VTKDRSDRGGGRGEGRRTEGDGCKKGPEGCEEREGNFHPVLGCKAGRTVQIPLEKVQISWRAKNKQKGAGGEEHNQGEGNRDEHFRTRRKEHPPIATLTHFQEWIAGGDA